MTSVGFEVGFVLEVLVPAELAAPVTPVNVLIMVHGMNKCFEFNNGSASVSAARAAVKSLRNGVLLPVSPYLSSSSNKEGSKKYSTLALPVTRSTAPRPALAFRSVSEDDCFGRAGVANVLVLELLIGFTEEKSSEQ